MIFKLTPEQVEAINARNRPRRVVGAISAAETREDAPDRARIARKWSRGGRVAKTPRLREAQVLDGCKKILENSPKVVMFWRQNTGRFQIQSRWVKFSFRGASDLMGIMDGGRFLAVECKASGKKPSREQAAFLENVRQAGGFAICVDDPAQLWAALRDAPIRDEPLTPYPADKFQRGYAT